MYSNVFCVLFSCKLLIIIGHWQEAPENISDKDKQQVSCW